jgi:hypothetical protein
MAHPGQKQIGTMALVGAAVAAVLCAVPARAQDATSLDCRVAPTIQSVQSTTPTTLEFVNQTLGGTVIVSWIDFQGKEQTFGTLPPGQSVVQPTLLTHAWKVTAADGGNSLNAVSCPSTTLCVAVDGLGNALTSFAPTGAASKWTLTPAIDGNGSLEGVSCRESGSCVAVDDAGYAVVGTHLAQPCVVPKLKGKTLAAAKRSLTTHGCQLGRVKHALSRTVRKGRVISQKPGAGKRLDHGAKVNLVVSRGK